MIIVFTAYHILKLPKTFLNLSSLSVASSSLDPTVLWLSQLSLYYFYTENIVVFSVYFKFQKAQIDIINRYSK